jgi:sulfur carrier protein ThiS
MKVEIQLFGLLGKKIPEFASPKGIEIELPDESTAGDLLEYLKIPEEWGVAVAMDSRLLKNKDRVKDGAEIRIFQLVHGG